MGRVVRRRGLLLIIPDRGPRYYVREDGAIGRRGRGKNSGLMFWVLRIDGAEVLATEDVYEDLLALDAAAEALAAMLAGLRS